MTKDKNISTEENQGKVEIKKSIWGRLFKFLAAFILVLVLLVTSFYVFFFDSLIKAKIIEQVKLKSKGLYTLEIGNIQTHFFSGNIEIFDVNFSKDSTTWSKLSQDSILKHHFRGEVKANKITLNNIEWWSFLQSKKLHVDTVTFDRADISVYKDLKIKGKRSVKEALIKLCASFSDDLSINELKFNQTSLALVLPTKAQVVKHTITNADFGFRGIDINVAAIKQKNKTVFTDSSKLFVDEYVIFLPKQGEISAKGIGVNTVDSTILVSNLHYQKNKDVTADVENIKIKNFNIDYFLDEKKILIDSIIVSKPQVNIGKVVQANRDDLNLKKRITELVVKVTPFIKIKSIMVENGKINLATYDKKNNVTHLNNAKGFWLKLVDFEIDETSKKNKPGKILFSNSVQLGIKKFNSFKSDSSLTFSLKDIDLKLTDSVLNLTHVYFHKPNKIDIKIPKLELYKANWPHYWSTGDMYVEELKLYQPNVKVYKLANSKVSNREEFTRVLGKLANLLHIDKVSFLQGKVNYKILNAEKGIEKIVIGQVTSILQDINLKPRMTKRALDKEVFNDLSYLSINRVKLHTVDKEKKVFVGAATSNFRKKEILLRSVKFSNGQKLHLKTDSIVVKAIDWKKYWNDPDKLFCIGFLKIKEPRIVLSGTERKDTLQQSPKPIKELLPELVGLFSQGVLIDSLNVDKARLIFHLKDTSDFTSVHKLSNIDLAYQNVKIYSSKDSISKFLYSDRVDFDIKKYSVQIPDKGINLKIKHFNFSNQDSTIFTDVQLKLKDKLVLTVPRLVAKDVDWENFWSSGALPVKSFYVETPILEYTFDSTKIKKQKLKSVSLSQSITNVLSSLLPSLTIESLEVLGGKFTGKIKDQKIELTQNADNIAISLKNVQIDSSTVQDLTKFLFVDDMLLRLNNFKFRTKDSLHTLGFDWLETRLKDSLLIFGGVQVSKKPDIDIKAASLVFQGIRFNELINHNVLNISKVEVNDPKINITKESKKKLVKVATKKSLYERLMKLPSTFLPITKKLKIDTLLVQSALVEIDIEDSLNTSHHQLLDGNVTVFNILVDTSSTKQEQNGKILFADNFIVDTKEYHIQNTDSTYNLHFFGLSLDSKKQSIDLDEFALKPYKDEEHFLDNKLLRETRFDFETGKIKITGLEYDQLINGEGLVLEKMSVNDPILLVYENKNIEKDSTILPPMPNEIFRKLPFLVNIHKLYFNQGYIKYTELEKGESKKGKIFFNDVNLDFTNIIKNKDTSILKEYLPFHVSANGLFMNRGRVKLNLGMDLIARDLDCKFNFHLDTMEANLINQMIVPNASIELKKGKIESVDLVKGSPVVMEKDTARGQMIARYQSFKFRIFEKQTKDKRRIATFFSNLVLLKNNKKKIGEIYYVRQPSDSFIKFLWSSIKSGLKNTVLPGYINPD